jgi:hypothetical protein
MARGVSANDPALVFVKSRISSIDEPFEQVRYRTRSIHEITATFSCSSF